jgi:hypothetical protein
MNKSTAHIDLTHTQNFRCRFYKMKLQFSVRDLLISTTLIAVGICSGVYLCKVGPADFGPFVVIFFFTFGVIGAGIFQLFHKPFLGVLVGFGVAMAVIVLMFLWLIFGFRHG